MTRHFASEPCHLTLRQLEALSDEELMAHLQGGQSDALAVLFDRYHRLVLKIASRILRDAAEGEDVMQIVFLDIYRAAAQFDPSKGSARVWFLQYAYHRSFNRREQLNNRNSYNQAIMQEIYKPEQAMATQRNAALPAQECSILVREGLQTLNRLQRTTLELAFFNGLAMEEIAEKTGETVANVRHHFYRGLNKLRSCLGIERAPREVGPIQKEAVGGEA